MSAGEAVSELLGAVPGSKLPRIQRLTSFKDPFRFDNNEQFKQVMLETLMHDASDVFITPGLPICARINGSMMAVTNRPLDDAEVMHILKWTAARETAKTDIISGKAVNGRYELFDPKERDVRGARLRYGYRVNASPIQVWGGTSCQIVLRAIPTEPHHYTDIGLNEEIVQAACPRDGIVYIAGATGSGKTTTFAAIIRYILENDTPIKGNLVTHEEPIEFTYDTILSNHSIIVQSQVPLHFPNFYAANREAMRRKPGLIMIGEMRDEETIRASVEASLTGHPVFGTVHSTNIAAVCRRLISRFPETERATAIFDIVETARFMMAQRLVKGVNGKLLAAREYLVFDTEVRGALIDLDQMGKVTGRVKELVESKGHSFRKEAARLLEAGLIDESVARSLEKE
ncbi:type IV secretion protein DotB (plasmid) [Xanthomonas citri pv. citri]|uniref:Type IV secretion system protein DotB n=4 Tax=Xanthomonas TaxID=338 RepID=A0A0U5BP33_XANCI|nr:type IV secretion protein DotB [Xanthomonas citri pv. citri]ATS86811.1 Flp pilus assembly complex ATPase component TadA [Xanthomonas citri pv. phaseoli var. fuscans]SOO23769.1 Type IV secretion system protein DotB [Xanthomonas phaseoli pv. phaseoli]ARR20029.1 type IV secretion protein DotB [Xanthomonas citri pv. citri]ARR24688.1 type IV secretion protein DotB [Xanthomonas citri pv. citri]